MFVSFFPNPKPFFWSAVLWTVLAVFFWYAAGEQLGLALGILPAGGGAVDGAKVSVFVSPGFIWFYIYYALAVGLFAGFWRFYAPHPWERWSVLGSALIIFVTYFQVQVSVAINAWYGPFYDLIQTALAKTAPVTQAQFFAQLASFAGIAFVAVAVGVMTRFFVSHYIFRWRTAMNDYYMAKWPQPAHHRRRLAAGAGRHHAVCAHHGGARRQPHRFGDDADRVPAGAAQAVGQCH